MYQPDFSSISGLIGHLNNDELKEIINDDTKFEDLLKDLEQLKSFETEKEMIIASNRSLAEYNLSKEPLLVEGREKIHELSESGQTIYKSIEEKINELKSKPGNLSTEDAYNSLQIQASNKEEESEKMAQHFLIGDMDVEQFLEDFALLRKNMHLLKFKVDKMKELMNTRSILGSTNPNIGSNYVNTPPSNSNFYPTPGSVPYPTGGMINMPMPGIYRNHFS